MAKAKTAVGLDVHATKIVAAVLDVETGELSQFSMDGQAAAAAGFCAGLPRPVRVAYEAGPTSISSISSSRAILYRVMPAVPPLGGHPRCYAHMLG